MTNEVSGLNSSPNAPIAFCPFCGYEPNDIERYLQMRSSYYFCVCNTLLRITGEFLLRKLSPNEAMGLVSDVVYSRSAAKRRKG